MGWAVRLAAIRTGRGWVQGGPVYALPRQSGQQAGAANVSGALTFTYSQDQALCSRILMPS
jgi:hypothetical protein